MDACAVLDDGYLIEEQKSAVATAPSIGDRSGHRSGKVLTIPVPLRLERRRAVSSRPSPAASSRAIVGWIRYERKPGEY
jgi:hypothetical protein